MTREAEIKRLKCERCGAKMILQRRLPVAALGPDYEFRTFECPRCGDTRLVAADHDGRKRDEKKRNAREALPEKT